MNHFFITGIHTGVGKSVMTGLIARAFLNLERSTITQKWVQSGDLDQPDISIHDTMLKTAHVFDTEIQSARTVYQFPTSLAPHLSAKVANVSINPSIICDKFTFLSKRFSHVLVEGSGGLMVPLTENTLFLDLVKKLNLAVIIVADPYLGAINHTLLTYHALHMFNLKCVCIIINEVTQNISPWIVDEFYKTLKHSLPIPIFGPIPNKKTTGVLDYFENKIEKQLVDILLKTVE